ncbi:MAG: hypothetical protein IT173_05155, partial [Acidobacteria bacterium]|nr:hypothetical protein [Acidobacteriota bacterium]
MRKAGIILFAIFLCSAAYAQSLIEPVYETQRAFERVLADRGARSAFTEFLSDDAVIFRPEAVNGRDFLRSADSLPDGTVNRTVHFADVSNNGLLAYTL